MYTLRYYDYHDADNNRGELIIEPVLEVSDRLEIFDQCLEDSLDAGEFLDYVILFLCDQHGEAYSIPIETTYYLTQDQIQLIKEQVRKYKDEHDL
jgi:hypothetical protein